MATKQGQDTLFRFSPGSQKTVQFDLSAPGGVVGPGVGGLRSGKRKPRLSTSKAADVGDVDPRYAIPGENYDEYQARQATLRPAVITSKAADKELDETIRPRFDEVEKELASHNRMLAERQRAEQEQQDALRARDETRKNPVTGEKVVGKGGGSTVVSDQPYGYNQRKVTYDDGTEAIIDQARNEDGSVSYRENAQAQRLEAAKLERERISVAYRAQADKVAKTIKDIQAGTMPLSRGEKAQVSALEQSYRTLINQQEQANASAVGLANLRGYQKGAAEYDPTFHVKTIGSIVSAGITKVAELNVTMAGAVAELQQSFKDNDIRAIKDSWEIYKEAASERSDTLSKTVTETQAAIKEAQAAQERAEKDYYDRVEKPIEEMAASAAENGAPVEVIRAIRDSGDVIGAVEAAGDYLQTATGDAGEYLLYKREAAAAGQAPVGFLDFLKQKEAMKGTASTGFDAFGTSIDFSDYTSTLSPERAEAFEAVPDALKASVKQLVDGDVLLADLVKSRGAAGTEQIQQLINYAMSVDPEFSVNQNKIRYEFKKKWDSTESNVGRNRIAINTAIGHLADFAHAAAKLPQGTVTKMNSVKNVLSKDFGDPAVTDFRINLAALSSELAAVYKGGNAAPTESEIETWENALAESFSKRQFQGAFDKTAELISSKITATRYQFLNTMGREWEKTVIDPDKRQMLIDAGIDPKRIAVEKVPTVADKLIKSESDAEARIQAYKTDNPGSGALMQQQYANLQKVLGHKPTALEFLETYGEYGKVAPAVDRVSLNRPQRNNNPGNLKTGSAADKLAVGVDDQGHLIFPDAATGKRALENDILAKVTGNSAAAEAKLGKQAETIAELNEVYAEDPNWKNNVAKFAGVTPDTRLSTIPRSRLVAAIMRAEGYTA